WSHQGEGDACVFPDQRGRHRRPPRAPADHRCLRRALTGVGAVGDNAAMPPINELTRIEPVHLARLERQGTFTTGLLLERSETPTRRQLLADQVAADTNDVLMWRDEALMLNLASFGPDEHQLFIQARINGLRDILGL